MGGVFGNHKTPGKKEVLGAIKKREVFKRP
jgi:hypothetical protein